MIERMLSYPQAEALPDEILSKRIIETRKYTRVAEAGMLVTAALGSLLYLISHDTPFAYGNTGAGLRELAVGTLFGGSLFYIRAVVGSANSSMMQEVQKSRMHLRGIGRMLPPHLTLSGLKQPHMYA